MSPGLPPVVRIVPTTQLFFAPSYEISDPQTNITAEHVLKWNASDTPSPIQDTLTILWARDDIGTLLGNQCVAYNALAKPGPLAYRDLDSQLRKLHSHYGGNVL
jgi:hypothetical protein